MTFLNPFVLIGLIAASFPVLFHLFAQRRARRVEFSTLQFLKQLEKNSMRKIKLRQILLLILRTLLIIFLVGAFARPAMQGYLGGFPGTSSANSTMVFLIDNSASMGERTTGGSYFKQSTDAAIKLLDIYKDGDEVVIIPLAGFDKEKYYEPLHDKREIVDRLAKMQTADAEADLGAGLRLASAALLRSLNINKEIFLFTDGQARNYSLSDSSAKVDTAKLKLFDERTKFYSILVGGAAAKSRNLSIDSLKAITTIFEPGRQIEFEAFIRNTSTDEVDAGTISLFFNGERVAQKSLDKLASSETRRFVISALPKTVGSLGVEASLEEDALPFDNKRFLTLEIPASRTVGLFFDKTSDAEYLKLALELTLTEANTLPYKIEYHRLEELRMLPALSRLDAVLVGLGSKLPEENDVSALREYISKGRGAAIYLLEGLDTKNYNSLVAPRLSTGMLQGKYIAFGDKYASFTQFDMAHPFFVGMFENKQAQTGIESPRFSSYYQFASSGTPIISLSGGSTFLTEHTIGKGSLLLYSAAPTLEMSDLPRKTIFLPLVRRTVAFVSSIRSGANEGENNFTTGSPVELEIQGADGEQAGSSLVLKTPDGAIRRIVTTASASGALRLDISGLSKAGIYTIYRDAEARVPVTAFAVNTRTDESDPKRATKEEMTKATASYFTSGDKNITYLNAEKDDISKTVGDSRFGVELWQTLLILALMCGVAEMFVAREGKNNS
jgi:hypothetical protein